MSETTSTASAPKQYAMYYTAATGSFAVGYVWNRIKWDGVSTWAPPAGSAIVLDEPDATTGVCAYPIGSSYTAAAS
ncbi:hypothetical protein AA103196_2261 [Ameyamaea chiangmaiensis NBRC 103196]|uniref:Uncharacterized protein n=1 Tax=Ameyamaea chiangmaiensis TaxID=442969 RepID=A0A850P4V8_9PROT|nr:hypothetical protein [Ameyamaea chiangmaiensis]MBS4075480.1 hypothetical protein [Ameyamaea chiangmaiensis]NVN38988.1 hypothetical protein [Ameyamaea chiangmaiensis]GBQ69614.1 hypothetical protein AA103196_2261 [Ameyamaea chiangmaiensis NBRC 103196]